MKRHTFILFLALGALALSSSLSAAPKTENQLKQHMLQRVTVIDELKLTGKVGENNVGLLTQRGMLSKDETNVLNRENEDRWALYEILAERLKLSVNVVGQGRAEELRKRSAKGVWLQAPDGNWYQQQ